MQPTLTHQTPPNETISVDSLIEHLGKLPCYSIGRSAGNTISIPNNRVSGQHATLICCSDHVYLLEDLGSKNGTFVNGTRITRKIISADDQLLFADSEYTVGTLLLLKPAPPTPGVASPAKKTLDFSDDFLQLQTVFEQYPKLRKNCRDREKMIRTGSVILSSMVGVGAALGSGGTALAILPLLSSAGLSVLIPTLCSTLLSVDEKLEVIDKEYRERYRCPNPACRDPFGTREWELLARQKTCRQCKAIWVS
ncbi:FHA domain-containing protein [uncultured Fibrella sp.]|uniref:FHA domain-containing protein n=1 Tax=uncultured Fibrella sp. TaxID=1284596 RepID=UPI0035C9C579